MKRKLQNIISASAASVLACSALAQDLTDPKPDSPEYSRQHAAKMQRADRLNGAAKASDIIGMTVKNYQDEKLGKVDDLAVDVESGRIVQVILSTGGFIGIGDTLTAVPPGALHHDVANKVLHLDTNKEKLVAAPKFETSKWAECCDSDHLSQVYRHYGEESSYTFVQNGDVVLESDRTPTAAPNADPTRNADGTKARARIAGKHHMIPAARLSQLQKASKIIGTSVQNLQDEKLGKVDNILLDLAAGRIVAVIVSSGGFLGLGDELSAIPSSALKFTADRETLQLDTTKEQLSQAPHFKANQWPDFDQPSYAHGVYRAYRVEPYFTTNLTTAADGTERKIRDRDDRTLTPLDQGFSKADVATTAQIRKEILAVKELSVNAKNVKIITIEGRVTLRGPVKTADEKRLIGQIADRVATAANVDNQLEVKLPTNGEF